MDAVTIKLPTTFDASQVASAHGKFADLLTDSYAFLNIVLIAITSGLDIPQGSSHQLHRLAKSQDYKILIDAMCNKEITQSTA